MCHDICNLKRPGDYSFGCECMVFSYFGCSHPEGGGAYDIRILYGVQMSSQVLMISGKGINSKIQGKLCPFFPKKKKKKTKSKIVCFVYTFLALF